MTISARPKTALAWLGAIAVTLQPCVQAAALATPPAAAAPAPVAPAEAKPDGCASLGAGRTFGDATVLSAQDVAGGAYTGSDGQKYTDLPAFCRIVARATPSPASNIIIEIWLPRADAWNAKILATGNGGFAGTVRSSALAGGLKRGYAVANTDMGTYPAGFQGLGYEAGNGRPEAVKDWGYRATHEMAELTKAVVTRYYGRAARHSYYSGCSTGGHQGLTEAQRFPEDFDAMLVGAAGHNRTHLHEMFTSLALIARRPGATMSPAAIKLWSDAMLKACVGKDGGAPGDAFLTDPTQCSYSPRALLCKPGQSDGCLQAGQVAALEAIYGGTRNPRTGGLIYPPEVRGIEGLLGLMLSGRPAGSGAVPGELNRWVFGPDWDPASFDFDKDMARVDAALAPIVNAMNPDLSKFAAHGGKLIMFHGWADPVVSPIDSVLYYDRIHADGHARQDFVRLFMAPGVSHCAGGAGPDQFGQGAEFAPGDPDSDLLAALDRWSETGTAPETVIARKYANSSPFGGPPPPGAVAIAERPLCAYPKVARYDGKGDAAKAASFTCTTAPRAHYERPAGEYLR